MSHVSSVEVKIQNVSRRRTPANAAIPGTKEVHPQNGLDLTNLKILFSNNHQYFHRLTEDF